MALAKPLIDAGVAQAGRAAATLHEIEAQSTTTREKMGELARATEAQAARIGEIVTSVSDLLRASAQTESVTEHSLATASGLGATASELLGLVRRFRTGEEEIDPAGGAGGGARQALLEWGPALQVGFSEIDRQHQVLVEIANRLHAAMQAGQAQQVCGVILDELADYAVQHFAFEERLMHSHGYPAREQHQEQHRKLVADVTDFKHQFQAGGATISVELMVFIRDWLVNHILKVDKALAADLRARGLH